MKLSLRLSYSNHLLVGIIFSLLLAITSVYPQTNLGFKKTQKETAEINELEVFADRFFKERNMDANNALVVLVKDKKTFLKHTQSIPNPFRN
jgi:hypothetical protein